MGHITDLTRNNQEAGFWVQIDADQMHPASGPPVLLLRQGHFDHQIAIFAVSFPEPKLAAQGGGVGLKAHLFTLAAVAVAGLPGYTVVLMGYTGKEFHLIGVAPVG